MRHHHIPKNEVVDLVLVLKKKPKRHISDQITKVLEKVEKDIAREKKGLKILEKDIKKAKRIIKKKGRSK